MIKKIRIDKWIERQMDIHFWHRDSGKSPKTCPCIPCKEERLKK
jgi:hypothetical protein